MENIKIGLSFGVLSDSISKQLKKQGFKFDTEKVKVFEKEVEAVTILRFGSGLLTVSMVDKIFQKLHREIVAHVAKENKLTIIKKQNDQ